MSELKLHTLSPAEGSTDNRKRVGRGSGSGLGKTSGRGHKGAQARSGYKYRHGNEGGQMPLHRRLPKQGFTNNFKREWQIINVKDLTNCQPGEVTVETLLQNGLISVSGGDVKVLGNGSIEAAYTVKAQAFSKSAKAKIEAAGGKAEVV